MHLIAASIIITVVLAFLFYIEEDMYVKDEITYKILINEPIKKSNMDIIRKNEDQ